MSRVTKEFMKCIRITPTIVEKWTINTTGDAIILWGPPKIQRRRREDGFEEGAGRFLHQLPEIIPPS